MTNIRLENNASTAKWVLVNGRRVIIAGRITEINETRKGHWRGFASGCHFMIYGGKAAGGASNEWFVRWSPLSDRDVIVNSAAEAIRLIEQA